MKNNRSSLSSICWIIGCICEKFEAPIDGYICGGLGRTHRANSKLVDICLLAGLFGVTDSERPGITTELTLTCWLLLTFIKAPSLARWWSYYLINPAFSIRCLYTSSKKEQYKLRVYLVPMTGSARRGKKTVKKTVEKTVYYETLVSFFSNY